MSGSLVFAPEGALEVGGFLAAVADGAADALAEADGVGGGVTIAVVGAVTTGSVVGGGRVAAIVESAVGAVGVVGGVRVAK